MIINSLSFSRNPLCNIFFVALRALGSYAERKEKKSGFYPLEYLSLTPSTPLNS
jgi:hypothetical protein